MISLCGTTWAYLKEDTHSYINEWMQQCRDQLMYRHFKMLGMKQNDTEPSITSAQAESWTWRLSFPDSIFNSQHAYQDHKMQKRHLLFFIHKTNTCNMLTKSKLLFVNKYIHVWQSLYNAKYSKNPNNCYNFSNLFKSMATFQLKTFKFDYSFLNAYRAQLKYLCLCN